MVEREISSAKVDLNISIQALKGLKRALLDPPEWQAGDSANAKKTTVLKWTRYIGTRATAPKNGQTVLLVPAPCGLTVNIEHSLFRTFYQDNVYSDEGEGFWRGNFLCRNKNIEIDDCWIALDDIAGLQQGLKDCADSHKED
jgi:hypothetical protein